MEMLKAMQSQMQKLNQRDEARNHKDAILDKSIQTLTTQVGQLAKDVADLKKNSGRLPSDTILNPSHQGSSSRNIHINAVSVVDAGRDSDCGRPLIPIQIGEYMTNKALLDYGSCISILPGSVYDQFDFGPLEEVSTTVVLADRSCKRPRGILRGVAVRVGDFYYPEDFIVLDYASDATEEQPTLILGRSFLATANVQINCRDNVVCMSFGNRKLNLSILSNSFTYFSDICSSAGTTNQCQPHVNEVDTKTKASMVDRSQVGVAEEEVKKEDEMKSNKAKPSVKQKATNSKKKSSKQEKSAELKKGDGIGDEEKAARKEAINSQSWRKKEDNRPNGKVFEGEFSFQPP